IRWRNTHMRPARLLSRARPRTGPIDEEAGASFYHTAIEADYERGAFAWSSRAEEHPFFSEFTWLLDTRGLRGGRALEIGAGRGAFQDQVADYIAVDLAASAAKWLHKPFVRANATALPFDDRTFDLVWSHYVLEHVAQPEQMLAEIARVIRPGGHMMISARWQAATWL